MDGSAMIVQIGTVGDSDVVHVNANSGSKGFMLEDGIMIDEVHHGLKRCWRVCKSKVHNCGFEKSVSGFERRFRFVPFANSYVVVPPSDVKFCVYMCIAKISDEV